MMKGKLFEKTEGKRRKKGKRKTRTRKEKNMKRTEKGKEE